MLKNRFRIVLESCDLDDFATVVVLSLNSDQSLYYLERSFEQQPDSQWIVDIVTNVTVYITKMNEQLSIVLPLNALKIGQKSLKDTWI